MVNQMGKRINECKFCGKDLIEYRACRINGTAYIEQFLNNTPINLVKERSNIPREEWDSAYLEFKAEAQTLNEEFKYEQNGKLKSNGWTTAY